jgi:hypothetical protein
MTVLSGRANMQHDELMRWTQNDLIARYIERLQHCLPHPRQ